MFYGSPFDRRNRARVCSHLVDGGESSAGGTFGYDIIRVNLLPIRYIISERHCSVILS